MRKENTVAAPQGFGREIQEWKAEALRLRREVFRTEVEFYNYLLAGESNERLWKGAYGDFSQLLEQLDLCDVGRYRGYRAAIVQNGNLDERTAMIIGVDGVIRAGRVQEKEKRREVVEDLRAASEKRGCPLSAREVERRVQRVAPILRLLKTGPSRVEEENSALRKQNAEMRREISLLRKENEDLRKKIEKIQRRG